MRDLVATCPTAARAVLALYGGYRHAREAADTLAARLSDGDLEAGGSNQLPTEEVSDLLQRHMNHFPELEAGAEALWREGRLDRRDLGEALATPARVARRQGARSAAPTRWTGPCAATTARPRTLRLSEVLRRGSRHFQLAYQLGLLTQAEALDRHAADPRLTSHASRALARVTLANYFAGAVLMPYAPFLEAARAVRYDIELLGHRFRSSFEQICHRLTTLRRPGAEGVPFHMVRVDIAGNISKHFSASGLRFARFSGACPRWNVFEAFTTPGADPHPAVAHARRRHLLLDGAHRPQGGRRLPRAAARCWPSGSAARSPTPGSWSTPTASTWARAAPWCRSGSPAASATGWTASSGPSRRSSIPSR